MTFLTADETLDYVAIERPGRRLLAASSYVPTYAGIALVAVGFVVIGLTWSRVAGTLNVGIQMPYVISGGFTALALVMSGLLLITVQARRQDGAERARQMDRLVTVVEELNARLDGLESGR